MAFTKVGNKVDSPEVPAFTTPSQDLPEMSRFSTGMGRRSSLRSMTGNQRLSQDFGCQNLMDFLDFSTDVVIDTPEPVTTTPNSSHVNTDRFKKRKTSLKRGSLESVPELKVTPTIISNKRGVSFEPILETPKLSDTRHRSSILKEVDDNQEYYTPETIENKENIERVLQKLPKENTSTPKSQEQLDGETSSTLEARQISQTLDLAPLLSAIESLRDDVKSEIQSLRCEMTNRLDQMDAKIDAFKEDYQFKSEQDKFHVFTFVHNSLRSNRQFIEEIDEIMGMLLSRVFNVAEPMQLHFPQDE